MGIISNEPTYPSTGTAAAQLQSSRLLRRSKPRFAATPQELAIVRINSAHSCATQAPLEDRGNPKGHGHNCRSLSALLPRIALCTPQRSSRSLYPCFQESHFSTTKM